MKAVRAHVQNGQIVLDEPVQLLDGADVQVLLPDHLEMTAQEMEELDAALDESAAQIERGEYVDAREFALRLLARS
jgi:hypothetical protein